MTKGSGRATQRGTIGDSRLTSTIAQREQIGQYMVIGEVGRGAMGLVLRARDAELDRDVAIKLLKGGAEATERARERFVQEAQAAGRLRHPNIVAVHEAGELDDCPYFVMEYVEGEPMEAWIERPRAWQRVVSPLIEVCSAVDHAHQQGVIHRDLKPANVMIDTAGAAHVMDFGVSRLLDSGLKTRDEAVMGTPVYMAPEQVEKGAGKIDARTDVYAIGVILYQALAGQLPFDGRSLPELYYNILCKDPVDPRKLRPEAPADLVAVALKAMEKDPDRRYQTAAEMGAELRSFRRGRGVRARPLSALGRLARWASANRLLAALAAALLLAGLTAPVVILLDHREQRRQAQQAEQALAEAVEQAELLVSFQEYDEAEPAIAAARRLPGSGREAVARRLDAATRSLERGRADQRAAEEAADEVRKAQALLASIADIERELPQLERNWIASKKDEGVTVAGVRLTPYQCRARLTEAKTRLLTARNEIVGRLTRALQLEPEQREARELLCQIYWQRFLESERNTKPSEQVLWRALLSSTDRDGAYARRLKGDGQITVRSRPVASGTIRPLQPGLREGLLRHGAPLWSGRADGGVVKLPMGQYLLELNAPGHRTLRYPFVVSRLQSLEPSLQLFPAADLPAGHALVSPGTVHLRPGRGMSGVQLSVPDPLLIAHHETTFARYLRFLDRLRAALPGVEQQHIPRTDRQVFARREASGRYAPAGAQPSWPVFGVNWHDAVTFCHWENQASGWLGRRLQAASKLRWRPQPAIALRGRRPAWKRLTVQQRGVVEADVPTDRWRAGGLLLNPGGSEMLRSELTVPRDFAVALDVTVPAADATLGVRFGMNTTDEELITLLLATRRPASLGWNTGPLQMAVTPIGGLVLRPGRQVIRLEVAGRFIRAVTQAGAVGARQSHRPSYRRTGEALPELRSPLDLLGSGAPIVIHSVQLLQLAAQDRAVVERLERQGGELRLPTEAEWLRGALGGGNRPYPWGQSWSAERTNCYHGSRPSSPLPGGSFGEDTSIFGLQDMGGNVREWVLNGGNQTWPLRIQLGGFYATGKGSDFQLTAGSLRAYAVDMRSPYIGFRTALTLPLD